MMGDQEEDQDAPTVHRFGSKRRIGTGDGDGDGSNRRPANFAEGQKQHMDIARREKQKRLELQQRQEAREGGDLDAGVPALAKLGPRAGTAASSSGSRRKTSGNDDGKGLSQANSGLSHGTHNHGIGSSDEGGSSSRSGSGSASGSDSSEFSE
jgi:hypothetical protein